MLQPFPGSLTASMVSIISNLGRLVAFITLNMYTFWIILLVFGSIFIGPLGLLKDMLLK